jgi:hypothetical protein
MLTIADLNQPAEYKATYVSHAMALEGLWHAWKEQHDGSLDITIKKGSGVERPPGLHASEISGCQRRLVYALQNTPKVIRNTVNMQRRFDLGTAVHEIVQWEFKEMCRWLGGSILFKPEVTISPQSSAAAEELNAYSSCDGIFEFYHQGSCYLRVGLEIKTMSDKEFDKTKAPKEDHFEQTCFYMRMLDLPLMWVLYYNKSNSFTTPGAAPYLYQYNPRLWDNTLRPRILAAYQMAHNNQLPAKQEGMPCDWCPYGHTCKPSYLSKAHYPTTTTIRAF